MLLGLFSFRALLKVAVVYIIDSFERFYSYEALSSLNTGVGCSLVEKEVLAS